MAISLQGVLFKTIIDPTGAEQGATRVNAAQAGMRKAFSNYAKQRMQDETAISKSLAAIEKQQAAYDAAVASSASPEKIAKLRASIEDLKSSHQSLTAEVNQRNALGADSVKAWQKNVAESEKTTKSFGAGLKSFAGSAGVAFGVVSAAAGVGVVALNKVADKLDTLGKRAKDFGINATGLYELQHQAELANVSTEELDIGLKTLATRAGEGSDSFSKLGINVKDASGKTKDIKTLLLETASALTGYSDENGKAAIASDLFGRNGLKVIRMLDGQKEALAEAFNSDKIDKAAAAAEVYNDTLENMSHSVMPDLYAAAGKILEVIDITHNYYMGTGDYASMMLNRLNEQTKREMAAQAAKAQAKRDDEQKQLEALAELDKKLVDSRRGEMNDNDKILNLKQQISSIEDQLQGMQEGTVEYTKLYGEYIAKNIELEKDQNKIIADRKRLIEDSEKKIKSAQDEAVKVAFDNLSVEEKVNKTKQNLIALKEKLSKSERGSAQYAEIYLEATKEKLKLAGLQKQVDDKANASSKARADYDYELKLRILKAKGKPDDAKKLEIQREYTRLLEMGFTAEQAAARLRAKANAEASKTVKYSDKDVKRAQDIIKRGESGTVGKKTLEQAQAIVSGQQIKGAAVGVFANAKKDAKTERATDLTNKAIAGLSGATATQQASARGATAQPATTQQTSPQGATTQGTPTADKSADALSQILDQLKTLTTSFKEAFA